jgi:Putative adhesin
MKTLVSLTAALLLATAAMAAPTPPAPATPKVAKTPEVTLGAVVDGQRPVSGRRTMAPDGEVRVENVSGSIKVVAWDRAEVEVKGTVGEDVERLEFGGSDDYTTIKVVLPRRHGSFDDASADLTISVPRMARLEVETVSADISVTDSAGAIRVNSVSGEVVLRTRSRDINASSVSGQVDVVGSGAGGRIEASSVSGDVRIEGVDAELELESVSGDADLKRSKVSRLRMQSTSGDVTYGGMLQANGSYEFQTVSGDVTVTLEGARDATFEVNSFSGDIDNSFGPKARRTDKYAPGLELRFTEGKGSARVRINTLSGEARLDGR